PGAVRKGASQTSSFPFVSKFCCFKPVQFVRCPKRPVIVTLQRPLCAGIQPHACRRGFPREKSGVADVGPAEDVVGANVVLQPPVADIEITPSATFSGGTGAAQANCWMRVKIGQFTLKKPSPGSCAANALNQAWDCMNI